MLRCMESGRLRIKGSRIRELSSKEFITYTGESLYVRSVRAYSELTDTIFEVGKCEPGALGFMRR